MLYEDYKEQIDRKGADIINAYQEFADFVKKTTVTDDEDSAAAYVAFKAVTMSDEIDKICEDV